MQYVTERNFRSIFEQFPAGVALASLEGKWLQANPKFCEMTGYTQDELTACAFHDISIGETPPAEAAAFDRLRSGIIPYYKNDAGYTLQNGSTAWVTLTASLLRDARGVPTHIVAVAEDVSRRNLAEELVRGQAETLTQALKALKAEPIVGRHLGQVLKTLMQQFEAAQGEMWLDDAEQGFSQPYLIVENGEVYPASDLPAYGRMTNGIPLTALEEISSYRALHLERRPYVLQEPMLDPELEAFRDLVEAHQGIQTVLLLPLVFDREYLGTFSLAHYEKREYRADELELAQTLVGQVVLASELTWLARKDRLEAQQTAILEERGRLAGELHDSLAQDLTGIIIYLQAALDKDTFDPADKMVHVRQAHRQAQKGLGELRRSVHALRPQLLESLPFVDAMRNLCERTAPYGTPQTAFSLFGLPRIMPAPVEDELLRIGQEALTNVFKHAAAEEAQVELFYHETALELRIKDDGHGFDPDRGDFGFGLLGMRERARRIGAELTVTSRPGQGTAVRVFLPAAALQAAF